MSKKAEGARCAAMGEEAIKGKKWEGPVRPQEFSNERLR